MSKQVEDNEPNTLEYRFYLNDDETRCMVHETYANSEAAIIHNDSIASKTTLPRILGISKINRLGVYGKPTNELHNLLMGIGAETFNLFTGFNRIKKGKS